ncbi:MAG: argininosuccinate synthase domain-containing protein [Cyanobacteria bacterium P01_D01_bin.50]
MIMHEFKGNKIGFCMSGGLSCLTVSKWLSEQGFDVINFVADIGQTDEGGVDELVRTLNMKGMRAVGVDLRHEMAEMSFNLLKYQAIYGDGYWNTTSASRAVLIMGLSPVMREYGCTVLAHGSVGGGNDQRRFDRYGKSLASDMKLFVPWRIPELLDLFPSRLSMIEYLASFELDFYSSDKAHHSTDANLAGISHEDKMLESLETPCTFIQPLISVWPQQASNEVETFEVRFDGGRAVEINNKSMTPLDVMVESNQIAGRNGIWMCNGLENRINGTKGRGVYEAPGLELLGYCLRQLYQATLDKQSDQLFETLSSLISKQVYEGRYFETASRASQMAMDELTANTNGRVKVSLYKGNIFFQCLRDYPIFPDTVQQKRFVAGGHRWQSGSAS